MKRLIETLILFRSDPTMPPPTWDATYSQARYVSNEWGRKNAAGLFFFTARKEAAICFERNSARPIYVTTCEITAQFNFWI